MGKIKYQSATQLGVELGSSPIRVNRMLKDLGYLLPQKKPEPTEKGWLYAKLCAGKEASGREYEYLRWDPAILEVLRAYGTPSRDEFNDLLAKVEDLTKKMKEISSGT